MHQLFAHLLNILLPQRCIGCDAYGERLCALCIGRVSPARQLDAQWMHAVCSYQNPMLKKALWELKYRERTSLAGPLGAMLADYLLEELAEHALWDGGREIVLVPIPLSRKRARERGYNHAALIARAVQSRLSAPNIAIAERALIKTRETPAQMSLDTRAKRLKNLAGAFEVRHPELLREKTVVLIDDITTTGATLREARKALREAGVKSVLAVAIAH